MELKRILARDTRSANEKAMQLYGNDVLVISTQRVGDQTELIVAIDAEATPSPQVQAQPRAERVTASEKDEVFAEIFGFVQRQEKMAQAPEGQAPAQTPVSVHAESVTVQAEPAMPSVSEVSAPPMPEDEAAPKAAKPQRKASPRKAPARTRAKPASAAPKSEKPTPATVDNGLAELLQQELARSREIVDLLRQEIGVLRREFTLARQVQPWESSLHMAPDVRALVDQLSGWGVPTGLRALLTDALAPCPDAPTAAHTLREILGSHLRACVSEPLPPGVHALIGPSGSGKTSMAVRLAHMHAAPHGLEQQAIISFADKRPGAWSQLQTLAAGVGVEVYRAQDAEALQLLLGELNHKTHVWIDTQADAHFAVPSALLDANAGIHCHAVAPLDASVASMQRLQSSLTPWRSLMLTKADECDGVWPWIQTLSEKPMPIACLSHSVRAQVAATPFAPEDWIQRALSGLQVEQISPVPKAKPKAAPRKRRSSASEKVAHG